MARGRERLPSSLSDHQTLDIARRFHIRDHLARILHGTHRHPRLHHDHLRRVPEVFHRGEVFGVPRVPQRLRAMAQVTRALRIRTVPRAEPAAALEVERDVVRQTRHPALVDAARKRARRQLVRHQRHIAAARAAGAIEAPPVKRHAAFLQAVIHKIQPPQCIQRLQVPEIVGRMLVLGWTALEVVHAHRNHVVPVGQLHRIRRARMKRAAPVVEIKKQAGFGSHLGQRPARIPDVDLHLARTRLPRPLLRGDQALRVGLGQRGPGIRRFAIPRNTCQQETPHAKRKRTHRQSFSFS